MKKTRFTAAFMAAAIALTCVPFTAASAQEIPEEYAAERELGWYDDDEYISWEAVDDSEEVYETVEAEEPEIYVWESGATTYNSTELGWSYVDGAAKYRVYKYSPSKGKYVKYKDVTGTTVNVTGLKAKKSYTFYVSALDRSGKVIVESPELSVTTPAKPSSKLSAPTGLTSTAKTQKTVTLKWNKVSGADGYRVYKYSIAKGKFVKYKDVTKTTLKVTGLKAGTSYKFMVASLVKKNGKYVVQNKSAEYTVATSAKSSGSSSSYVSDGTYIAPGQMGLLSMGESIKKAISISKIGYYKMDSNPFSNGGKMCVGQTIYAGEYCGLVLYFNSKGQLYEYMLKVPTTYLQFLSAVDTVKKNYDYDYIYDDGYYFFGSSILSLTLNYDNNAMYMFVESSLYK